MDITEIKRLCADETIEISSHIQQRMLQRGVSYKEVKQALMNGEIIEDYPDDYPYPSCLVLGTTSNGKKLHIVAGIGEEKLWLITVYVPNVILWDETLTKRRTENND